MSKVNIKIPLIIIVNTVFENIVFSTIFKIYIIILPELQDAWPT